MQARIIYSEDSQTWLKVTSARIIIPNSEQSENTDF